VEVVEPVGNTLKMTKKLPKMKEILEIIRKQDKFPQEILETEPLFPLETTKKIKNNETLDN